MVQCCYFSSELEEKFTDTLHSPGICCPTAAQSMPVTWQNHQLWVGHPCLRWKSNIMLMVTISFLEGNSHPSIEFRAFCSYWVVPPLPQATHIVPSTCSRPPALSSPAGIWRECLKFFGLNTCKEGNENQMLKWHEKLHIINVIHV